MSSIAQYAVGDELDGHADCPTRDVLEVAHVKVGAVPIEGGQQPTGGSDPKLRIPWFWKRREEVRIGPRLGGRLFGGFLLAASALVWARTSGGMSSATRESAGTSQPATAESFPVPAGVAAEEGREGPLTVVGVIDPTTTDSAQDPPRICSIAGDSDPPTCLGPSLLLEGLSERELRPLLRHASGQSVLRGVVQDGVLTVQEIVG